MVNISVTLSNFQQHIEGPSNKCISVDHFLLFAVSRNLIFILTMCLGNVPLLNPQCVLEELLASE